MGMYCDCIAVSSDDTKSLSFCILNFVLMSFSQELLSAFKEKVTNAKNIAIFGHESVDGDAVGSMLGLGKICEKLGKNVGYFTTITP